MKPLNKTAVYSLIAILLGTVTMIAPLALLGSNEKGSQELLDITRGNENFYAAPDSEQLENASYNIVAVTPSDILQVGLLIIPSFLVALGAFVYFKKRSF